MPDDDVMTMRNVTIPASEVIRLRTLLEEYDELNKRYQVIPSGDPGMAMIDSMERRLIGFVRSVCKNNLDT